MSKRKRDITRRSFIQTTGAAALAGPSLLSACGDDGGSGERRTLRILQQGHFVPSYDTWFDQFATEWGADNDVDVVVEHVSRPMLGSRTQQAIDAGRGPDLIEHVTPPGQYELAVHDLADLHQAAEMQFGPPHEFFRRTVYNPATDKYYGFAPGWAPNNGDYRRSMWEAVGLANGPRTYEELMTGGTAIKEMMNIPIALGMSNELDASSYLPGILLAFGASVQDENHNVVINSPETIEAINYVVQLYESAQGSGPNNPAPFGDNWTSGTNNQLFNGGDASFIINPISHYRAAQKDPSLSAVADDNFMTKALMGPAGAIVPANISFAYVVPQYSMNLDLASEFLLALTAQYAQVVEQTELYNHPSYPDTVPTHGSLLGDDPFGSTPSDKLAVLADAPSWNVNVGHPGSDNPALGEVMFEFIVPKMFAAAAQGMEAQQAVMEAEAQINAIYESWRGMGLV